MASDLARVTCLVSKQTEPGPRQLDFSLLLNHNGLGSCVTRNGEVKVQGRLKLEDCVHSGPQMWPELVQKSDVACTSPSPDLRLLPLPSPASHDAHLESLVFL